jgi:hypothetical protein
MSLNVIMNGDVKNEFKSFQNLSKQRRSYADKQTFAIDFIIRKWKADKRRADIYARILTLNKLYGSSKGRSIIEILLSNGRYSYGRIL